MSNGNGPGQGSNGQPVPVGTGEVRTFPASHPSRGARRSSSSCEGEPDDDGNPWSRCSEANSTNEELTEPLLLLFAQIRHSTQGPKALRGFSFGKNNSFMANHCGSRNR